LYEEEVAEVAIWHDSYDAMGDYHDKLHKLNDCYERLDEFADFQYARFLDRRKIVVAVHDDVNT
jgi:hypothetical protein